MSLAELQLELSESTAAKDFKRVLVPVAMLLVAGIVAVGTVPIALIFIAEFLTQAAGLSRAATFSIATMSGFGVALVIGVVGWSYLRGVVHVFERSREELTCDIDLDQACFEATGADRIAVTSRSLIFPATMNLRSLKWPRRQENTRTRNRETRPGRDGPRVRTTKSALEHFQEYRGECPGVVALWCFGIGFVLGWKCKLW